jgi:hypothetical protein
VVGTSFGTSFGQRHDRWGEHAAGRQNPEEIPTPEPAETCTPGVDEGAIGLDPDGHEVGTSRVHTRRGGALGHVRSVVGILGKDRGYTSNATGRRAVFADFVHDRLKPSLALTFREVRPHGQRREFDLLLVAEIRQRRGRISLVPLPPGPGARPVVEIGPPVPDAHQSFTHRQRSDPSRSGPIFRAAHESLLDTVSKEIPNTPEQRGLVEDRNVA